MKMTKEQYLLSCLIEECAEVSQRCTKILRFGLNEVQEGQTLTNAERLAYEFNDLMGVLELLQEDTIIPNLFDAVMMDAKKAKMEKYMDYSREQGTLE